FGTPNYMSPEQAEGRGIEVDARTDLFALGAIVYEMVTGTLAFQGSTPVTTLYQVCHKEPPTLRRLAPELPEAADRAIKRALAKSPEDRWQTVGEFFAAFAEGCGVRETAAHPVFATMTPPAATAAPAAAPPAGTLPKMATSYLVHEAKAKTRRRAAVGMAGVAAAVVVVALAFVALRPGGDHAAIAPSAAHPIPAASIPPALPAMPRPVVPPLAVAPAPATVRVALELTPADAIVAVDGVVTRENPLALPRGETARTLRVSAGGHVSRDVTVVPSADMTVAIALEPKRPRRGGARPARRAESDAPAIPAPARPKKRLLEDDL
ncbi:MAG: hypothetical protein AABZ30_03675, partial [Myxococcota bacterium]